MELDNSYSIHSLVSLLCFVFMDLKYLCESDPSHGTYKEEVNSSCFLLPWGMEDDMRTEFSTFSDILKEQQHCLHYYNQ